MTYMIPIKLSIDRIIWLISCALFIAGIILPMFSFHQLYFFDDTFSLIASIVLLFKEGELFLFVLIFSFSILAPLYKLYVINILISAKPVNQENRVKFVRRLASLGKWSMADVFVVAILASTVKMDIIASVSVHSGLVFFGLAVLASMLMVEKQLLGYELRPIDENA